MKCNVCKGRKTLNVGNGVVVTCTGCEGKGTLSTTLADRLAASIKQRQSETAAAGAPTVLRFVVEGHPVPKGRPRFSSITTRGGRVITRAYTPEETEAYEAKVKIVAQIAVNQARWCWSKKDRFHVLLTIVRHHESVGGDIDNHAKIFLDSMNKIVWSDDRYVRGLGAFLGRPDPNRERVTVEIRRLKGAA